MRIYPKATRVLLVNFIFAPKSLALVAKFALSLVAAPLAFLAYAFDLIFRARYFRMRAVYKRKFSNLCLCKLGLKAKRAKINQCAAVC